MNFAYLTIDMIVLLPPLAFSFHPRFPFNRRWKTYWPAILHIALIFLVWDVYFTRLGVWGFNPHDVIGLYIERLPMEELLFFICIPFACLFTGFCWSRYGLRGPNKAVTELVTMVLIGFLLAVGFFNLRRRYTAATFISLGVLLILCRYVWKTAWLGKFYLNWAVLLAPLLLIDGVLTGTGLSQPIVWYNRADILGWRVLTVPIEDFFYGMELILLNVLAAHKWERIRRGIRHKGVVLLE